MQNFLKKKLNKIDWYKANEIIIVSLIQGL